MSDRPVSEVVAGAKAVRAALHAWGYRHANAFMSVSTLSLPVSPALKLTDQGLVDVDRRAWADAGRLARLTRKRIRRFWIGHTIAARVRLTASVSERTLAEGPLAHARGEAASRASDKRGRRGGQKHTTSAAREPAAPGQDRR